MEKKDDCKILSNEIEVQLQELLQKLEKTSHWDGRPLVKYNGLWYAQEALRPLLSSQKNFRANDTDILVTSMLKSGTTWLNAIVFSIANRNKINMKADAAGVDPNPLLTTNPHMLVPSLEQIVYWENDDPDLHHMPSPRIFSTHRSYALVADLISGSESRVVYICRNPLDQFISSRHFYLNNDLGKKQNTLPIDEAFDQFCKGIHVYGPIWEQILGYWKAHLENPKKVLFLRYEELHADTVSHVKRIAEFIGQPFTAAEESRGVPEEIVRTCSFEHLSNLAINKTGSFRVKNSSFFRKGVVGDWTNYVSPEMAQRLRKVVESKLEGTGLQLFKV